MSFFYRFLIFIILIAFTFPDASCQVYEWEDVSEGIKFTIDLSPTGYVEGILFLTFSGEYDSGDIIGENPYYESIKELCAKNHLAYLGARLHKCDIRESYDEAMAYFATVSLHSELKNAPLIIEGVSYGTEFATCFAYTQFQDKIIAYIIHSGWHALSHVEDDNNLKIPALWITGGLNEDGWLTRISELFYEYRQKGALWTLVIVPGMGHEMADNELIHPYIDTLMDLRKITNSTELNILEEDQIMLGNNLNYEYTPYSEYIYDTDSASCLPSSSFADVWKKYNTGNFPTYLEPNTVDKETNLTYRLADNKIIIRNLYSESDIHVYLFDLNGRLIKESTANTNQSVDFAISTEGLKNGIYVMRITTDDFNRVFILSFL